MLTKTKLTEKPEYMTVAPSFKFRIDNTNIEGYVTAETFEDAVDILRKIHLGPKEIFTHEFEGVKSELIKSAPITICKKQTSQIPIQISKVEER